LLFDLRGRGRRRTVQGIYLVLAVLMGGGLVFFGIGGGTTGGLLDAFKGGSGGGSPSKLLKNDVRKAQARARVQPRDPASWAALARAEFQLARSGGDNYDANTGRYKGDGRRELARAAAAWDRYLALNPRRPDDTLAALMVTAFYPTALNLPAKAATAQEIVARANPSANTYYQLAAFAYAAGQTRKGDLAGEEAVRRAPATERAVVKSRIDQLKKRGAEVGSSATPSASG
jgi:hypothetical protein